VKNVGQGKREKDISITTTGGKEMGEVSGGWAKDGFLNTGGLHEKRKKKDK